MNKATFASILLVAVIAAILCWRFGMWPVQVWSSTKDHDARIHELEAIADRQEKCLNNNFRQLTAIESKLDAIDDKIERILHGKGPEQLFLGGAIKKTDPIHLDK
jgi:peptidoglycan hydrolase CwlO-like protein